MKKQQSKRIGNKNRFTNRILPALHVLSDPVKATLGPDGLPILIEQEGKPPLITKDGVTVAESIHVEDRVDNTIIQAVKEAAKKTNELVGDGTTTAIVLTEAIIEQGMKYVKSGLISPQALVCQIKSLLPNITKFLEHSKKSIASEEEIRYVASISSNSDSEIAAKTTEAIVRSGKDGLVVLEDGSGADITVTHIEGYQIMKGWAVHKEYATRMLTDPLKQEISFVHNPSIVLYDGEMTSLGEFSDFMMAFNEIDTFTNRAANIRQLVVVAHKFSGQIRQLVADNMMQNGLPVMLVETEMLITMASQSLMLGDLAIYTGGKVVQQGHLKDFIIRGSAPTTTRVDPASGVLGQCEKVKQDKGVTTFYGGNANAEALKNHVQIIQKQIQDAGSVWDEQIHKKRVARLLDGVVVMAVGGVTALEIGEKKARVEDAVNATKAALKEGVVPGGGIALLNVMCTMSDCIVNGRDNLTGVDYGWKVMQEVLQAPIRQIISNTGQSPDTIVNELISIKRKNKDSVTSGYNALTRAVVKDMFAEGVIDPYLVVRTALENAASIGCEMLRGGGYCVSTAESDDWVDHKLAENALMGGMESNPDEGSEYA